MDSNHDKVIQSLLCGLANVTGYDPLLAVKWLVGKLRKLLSGLGISS